MLRGAWRPCSGSSSTFLSWWMLLRTSRTARPHCAGAHHACTTFVLWLPVAHLPVAVAGHVRGNLGNGCLWPDTRTYSLSTVPVEKLILNMWMCHDSISSVITHKLIVSGPNLLDNFSCLGMLSWCPSLFSPFCHSLCRTRHVAIPLVQLADGSVSECFPVVTLTLNNETTMSCCCIGLICLFRLSCRKMSLPERMQFVLILKNRWLSS
jgi:hypothetical protein